MDKEFFTELGKGLLLLLLCMGAIVHFFYPMTQPTTTNTNTIENEQ